MWHMTYLHKIHAISCKNNPKQLIVIHRNILAMSHVMQTTRFQKLASSTDTWNDHFLWRHCYLFKLLELGPLTFNGKKKSGKKGSPSWFSNMLHWYFAIPSIDSNCYINLCLKKLLHCKPFHKITNDIQSSHKEINANWEQIKSSLNA